MVDWILLWARCIFRQCKYCYIFEILNILNFEHEQEAQTQRIHDLEDNVRNLRKLLSSREVEVHDLSNELKELKTLNQQLTQELDAAKMREQRSSPAYSNVQEVKQQNFYHLTNKMTKEGSSRKL